MEKCYAQPRCEHQLILFLADGRIRDVGVAKVILPSQPFDDLGCGPEIEIDSIIAGIGCQIWKEGYVLDHRRVFAQL